MPSSYKVEAYRNALKEHVLRVIATVPTYQERQPSDSEALLQRAQQGDCDAFARLCEAHRKRVWSVAASVAKNAADADDLAQDALIKAWKALPSFRADAPFEAWLCRITLHTAQDWVRSAWKRRVLSWGAVHDNGGAEEVAPDDGPEEEVARREIQKRVRAEVARLGPKERTPIWLLYFEGFSLADVARLENVPESTVRSRVKVGLKRLHSPLKDLDEMNEENTPMPRFHLSESTSDGIVSTTPWKGCAT